MEVAWEEGERKEKCAEGIKKGGTGSWVKMLCSFFDVLFELLRLDSRTISSKIGLSNKTVS